MANRYYQKGCVFKRGKKRKVWVGRWRERVIEAGEIVQVQRSAVLGPVAELSKKQAQQELDRLLAEINSPHYTLRASLTFAEFANNHWTTYQEQNLKPSTRAAYSSHLRKHLLPVFGDSRLEEIKPLQVLDFLGRKRKTGMSPRTLLNLYVLLQRMLNLAVDLDLLPSNPMRRVPKPRVERKEKPTITPTQVRAVIEAVPERYRALLVVLYFYGLRAGEAFGLKWKDIDCAAGKVYFRNAVWRRVDQSLKTRGSTRTGYLAPSVAAALVRHKELSHYTQPDDYVFTNNKGKPLDLNNVLKRVLYPAQDAVGIKRTRPREFGTHLFRHSAGSHLHEETGDLKQTQEFLRHSSVAVTGDVYVHLQPGAKMAALKKLERAVFPDLFPSVPKSGEKAQPATIN